MSYSKHNYKKGDELLASQLNEMDDQIALNEEKVDKAIYQGQPFTFRTGKNIFNLDTVTPGEYIAWNNGQTNEGAAYVISDYMPIESGNYYFISWPNQTCIYDANKNYIGGFYLVTKSGTTTVYSSDNFPDQSDWLISYTTWTEPIIIRAQQNWAYIKQTISINNYEAYMFEKLVFEKNLFNSSTVTPGEYIAWNNGQTNEGAAYVISDYMPIESGNYYFISWPNQTCIYDANKNYIGGFYLVTRSGTTTVYSSDNFPDQSDWLISYTTWTEPIVIRAQQNWAYIKQTISVNVYETYTFQRLSVPTAYEPYHLTTNNLAVDSSLLLNMNKIFYDRLFSKIVQTPVNIKLLGDSITAGVGGTGYNASSTGGGEKIINNVYVNVNGHCWANSLKAYWESKFNCVINNYGWSGIASSSIITYWNTLVKATDDIIICMIGTNDRAECNDLVEFIQNLESIYLKAMQSSKQLVFIASIPASIANENNGTKHFHMEDVEHAVRYVTDKYNIPFVNLYSMFIEYCESRNITIDSLLSDGLHPNDDGYDAIFYLISNAFNISTKRPDADW